MKTYAVINYHNLNKSTIRHIKQSFTILFSLGVSMVKYILNYPYVLNNKYWMKKFNTKYSMKYTYIKIRI
jgi:hypothetical protein